MLPSHPSHPLASNQLSHQHLTDNPFRLLTSQVWGGNDAEAIEKVHAFFQSSHFQHLPVIPGAVSGLTALRSLGFSLAVVTSRQLTIESATRSWLSLHFPPGTFSAVEFGNHWGRSGRKTTKAELCQKLEASLLIDDSLIYATEVAEAGIPVLLFDLGGTYNWSKSDTPLPERVTRVDAWEQVVEQVRKLLL